MKLLNYNTPLSNFIYSIITEKNKQIKENILLGNIKFNDILFYSNQKENTPLKTPSHLSFLNNLQRQKQLLEVREEKANLEKKVSLADNQLLSIKNKSKVINNLNFNERYIYTNLNNSKVNHTNSNSKNSKSKNKNKKSLSSEKKTEKINSLPTLGKEKKENNKMKMKNIYVRNIVIKPIEIKSFKSNSKINNHETEEKLEKNARAFIQKINKNKQKELAKINKRQQRFALKLKNEIEKKQRENNLKLNEYNRIQYMYKNNGENFIQNSHNNNNGNNYSNVYRMREDNEYSPDNSMIKRHKNKKYHHYSPYNYKNPKMLKNISKDLLNFNSELYYNNNIPDILQYQYLLSPFYKNNNMINKRRSTPYIDIEDINNMYMNNNIQNIPDIIDMTNGEIHGNNISRFNNNNYSSRIDESNMDSNIIDNSFNKKHLYFFNEPKYELENTSAENEMDKTNEK